ncbi:hypothetical protein K505DRAFT_371211 [Melanomma pulvis-pyrius CBS 109.77]|uniref:Large ribosomal subunit protein mL54 n=1 Tax=Melanomma pulvis-pyrius CBS 109.77 TaxID=1314802 RepID=A0A6A6XRP5_9PLEO|nr:hypothetical protein K505DRAFT_371211 [Melanomma pulvis-pyrius CBS 109.77]
MICRNCLRAAARRQIPKFSSSQTPRFLSSSLALHNANPISASTAPPPTPQTTPPNSTSTPPAVPNSSANAQALGEALAPPAKKGSKESGKSHLVKSSIAAGTPLKGLNFLKNQSDPIAMEDSEYPAWLWTVLEKQEKKGEAAAAGDLFSKSKKQRRVAAKRLRKEQLANPGLLVPKIPIYEQTIDLPAGDGTVEGAMMAAGAREELRKAMRTKRRATIKENNFLRAMR